jgi:hypothetical protein
MVLEHLNTSISTCTKNVSSGHRKTFCLSKAESRIKVNLERGMKIIWSVRYVGILKINKCIKMHHGNERKDVT